MFNRLMLFGVRHPVTFTVICCAAMPAIVIVGMVAGIEKMIESKPLSH